MTTLRAAFLVALAGALASSGPAGAQEAPDAAQQGAAPAGDDIVVTGERPTRTEVTRQARDITDIGSDVRDRPLARIEDRLCPGVIGLKRDGAELMIDRIRWNAERLHMWMADDTDCRPNLIIAFVEDGQAELAGIADRQPWLFADLTTAQRRALLATEGPVRVWTTALTRTRDGMPIERRESLDSPPQVEMWMAHSKLYLTIREDITQTVVLFDREGVRGKSIIQLADYATMRGFARTRPAEGDARLDTILALFDPNHEPPAALTDFDQAYLTNLYKEIANLPAAMRLADVSNELERLARDEAAAAPGDPAPESATSQ
jgi:hypothetical protein